MSEYLQTPNIFEYATSELSQDAFICWTLAGINYPNTAINKFSKAFLDLILKSSLNQLHKAYYFNSQDVVHIDIERQKDNIDILATLEIDNGYGKSYKTLIIEDKVFSTQHNNQLFRYKNMYKDKDPICVYYKTGYIFNDCIIANANEYAVISIDELFVLFEKFENRISSDIFKGYYKYICGLKNSYDQKQSDFINNLNSHIGQFTLMSKLVPKFNDMVKSKADYENEIHPIIVDRMELGQNIGGTPWTQYTLLFKEDSEPVSEGWVPLSDSYVDNIFCRIDRNNKGYYFSLRQYNHNNNDMDKIAVRLPFLRELFAQVVKEVEDERADQVPPLKLAHYFKNDNKGRFESKIADIYLDKLDKEDLKILIDLLPIALRKFIDLIKLNA